jgi:hypothetical protein
MKKTMVKDTEIWPEENILMIKMSGELTSEELEEIVKVSADMIKKSGLKYILVVSDVVKMPLSARKAATKIYEDKSIKKMAFICDNPVTKAIATFLLGVYKLTVPTRIFDNAEEAKNWFREK